MDSKVYFLLATLCITSSSSPLFSFVSLNSASSTPLLASSSSSSEITSSSGLYSSSAKRRKKLDDWLVHEKSGANKIVWGLHKGLDLKEIVL